MKRDMDLIRKILLSVEENPTAEIKEVIIEGYNKEQIHYHIEKLIEAGYLRSASYSSIDGISYYKNVSLKWNGHEFLDASRSETIWNKAKTMINETGGSFTIDILLTVLRTLTLSQLGITS